MGTLAKIEEAAKAYADRRELLSLRVENLNTDVEAMKRNHLPDIKRAAADAATARGALETLIDSSRELFVRPKTLVIANIKFGLQKVKDSLVWDDDEHLIAMIKKVCTADQAELLIRKVEEVNTEALKQLEDELLKLLGVVAKEGSDVVMIKPASGDVDKIVNALLKESADKAERQVA